jgi:hypothetical protein
METNDDRGILLQVVRGTSESTRGDSILELQPLWSEPRGKAF